MRAHYKSFPDKRSKDLYERKVDEMQKGFAILYEKVMIYTMHTMFGYGVKRLKELFDTVGDSVDLMHSDPAFWDKVDKVVIDKLGFDYPRCNYEYMENVFYDAPKVSAEEKRDAVEKFRKMKEFLESERT